MIGESVIKASIDATNDAVKAFLAVFRQAGARTQLREAERELLEKNPDLVKIEGIIQEAKRLEGRSGDVRRVEAMQQDVAKHRRSTKTSPKNKGAKERPRSAAAKHKTKKPVKKQKAKMSAKKRPL